MVRPLVLIRPDPRVLLALALSLGVGCASSEAGRRDPQREAREEARAAKPSHVQQATYADDASPEMTVSGGEGTLNEADVETALNEHFGEIRGCFRLGHRSPARPYGRVLMRLFVDGKGEVDDVAILESNIGNHLIERCVADICLGVVFEAPAGHQATTFDYPVEIRPARAVTADRQRRP
jgi:hypothetical protein